MLNFRTGIIAIIFSTIAQLSNRMISIVSLVVLARVLTPEDFGLVGIAMIFVTFSQSLGATGGHNYLLSRQEINDEMVFTSWTLDFLIYLAFASVLAVSSGYIAEYYEDDRLQAILWALSLLILMRAINSPKLVYKHKKQELGAISSWMVINKFISVGLTIAIAIIYESYWALVIGHLISTGGYALGTYYIAPAIPKLTLKNIKPQWGFCKWIMPRSIIGFAQSQIDTIWVSLHFDKPTIGAYNSMRYYASLPNMMLINTVYSALLPQIAEFKNNKPYYQKQMQVLLFIMALICSPIIYLMAFHANFVIGFILGSQWQPYSDLLAIFAFMIITMTTVNLASQIAMVNDSTKLLFYFSLASIVAHVGLFALVKFDDIYQLAIYKLTIDIFLSCGFLVYLIKIVFGAKAIFSLLWPIAPVAAYSYGAGVLTGMVITDTSQILGFLAHCTLMCCLFLLFNFLMIRIYKTRVHCFNYAYEVLLKGFDQLNRVKRKLV